MFRIEISQKLYLVLSVINFTPKYYNTSDIQILAEKYAKHLVRLKVHKKNPTFPGDTRSGGLRGNISNILTWEGLFKKGNRIESYYGVGPSDRLSNAMKKGLINLDIENGKYYANTKNKSLHKIIENESELHGIREEQSHLQQFLKKNPQHRLQRIQFPEFKNQGIVYAKNSNKEKIFFYRAKINTYKNKKKSVVEYKLYPYWEGIKLKKFNIHLLLVVPNQNNIWGDIYAIGFENLLVNTPIVLYFDRYKQICEDSDGNKYTPVPLQEAIKKFSNSTANNKERLKYDWKKIKENIWEKKALQQTNTHFKRDEFYLFLEEFLEWEKTFKLGKQEIVDLEVSSSSGADVLLHFAGNTKTKLELEHNWRNYIDHKHHESGAWQNCWLWASEAWDDNKVIAIFKPHITSKNSSRIPTNFLGIENGIKKLFVINWTNGNIKKELKS